MCRCISDYILKEQNNNKKHRSEANKKNSKEPDWNSEKSQTSWCIDLQQKRQKNNFLVQRALIVTAKPSNRKNFNQIPLKKGKKKTHKIGIDPIVKLICCSKNRITVQ